jgi:glycosyltransferase
MTTIRNSILRENKGFNESFQIAADYDLMLRILLLRDVVVEYLPATFVRMELGGISNGSLAGVIKSNIEVIKSWRNIRGHAVPYWVFFIKPLNKITQLRRRNLE